jgi:hypothetical protein
MSIEKIGPSNMQSFPESSRTGAVRPAKQEGGPVAEYHTHQPRRQQMAGGVKGT